MGAGGFALYWLMRKAQAGEADARADAAKAYARAADASARAAAAGREAASQRAAAAAAGRAAQAAQAAANDAIMQAKSLTAQARDLSNQALAERDATKKVALEREAALKAAYAAQLAQNAQLAQQKAAQATAAAHAREAVASKATDVAVKPAVDSAIVMDLERKRLIVADGFASLLAEVKRRNPSMSTQQATNTAAAFLRGKGINLDKPDPALAFWKLPAEEIQRLVLVAANEYATSKPPGPSKTTAAPQVVTKVDPAKLALVQDTYAQAIAYAMDVYRQKGKALTAEQAYGIIAEPFRRASSLAPGAAAVPVPAQLQSPSPFWANPLSTIQTAMRAALAAAQREVNAKFEPLTGPPDPNFKPASVASTVGLTVLGFAAISAVIGIPLYLDRAGPGWAHRRHEVQHRRR